MQVRETQGADVRRVRQGAQAQAAAGGVHGDGGRRGGRRVDGLDGELVGRGMGDAGRCGERVGRRAQLWGGRGGLLRRTRAGRRRGRDGSGLHRQLQVAPGVALPAAPHRAILKTAPSAKKMKIELQLYSKKFMQKKTLRCFFYAFLRARAVRSTVYARSFSFAEPAERCISDERGEHDTTPRSRRAHESSLC